MFQKAAGARRIYCAATLSFAGALTLIAPVSAADMPVKAPQPVAGYSWTGCYVGGNVGALVNDSKYTIGSGGTALTNPLFIPFNPLRTDSANFTDTALTVGGQIGCNYQFAARWVIGIEGDFNYSGISELDSVDRPVVAPLVGRFAHTVTQDVDWFATLRGRLGFALDRWLVYATGGLAYGKVKSNSEARFSSGELYVGSISSTRTGWTVGGGTEYAFANNWTLKAEYLYVDLGEVTYEYPCVPPLCAVTPGLAERTDLTTGFHVLRLGLNYKFGEAPIAARY